MLRTLGGYALGLAAMLAMASGQPASAATLCVNSAGTGGCFTTIGAAVAAAVAGDTIAVQAGTYTESVTIGKPLALVGAGASSTVINAVGRSNGIYVDGLDNAPLSRVAISGFTVENANFEGILVTNASDVTIFDNWVVDNDRSLVITSGSGNCAGLPAFETAEGDDCGEGIHLLGATYSTVSNNLSQGNAGGILLSDDTGPNHDNLIHNNAVRGNVYDCGITLASHPAASGAKSSPGVYNNTIADNSSVNNGVKAPGGAGVGMFASVPGAATYNNVVIGNIAKSNGGPGVAMHSHTPGQFLTGNRIIDNTLSGNGADTGDAATAGPTGINLFAVSPASGTVISGNMISDESIDLAVNTKAVITAHLNQFLGGGTGISNLGAGSIDATLSWWGCANGPPGAGCSGVNGARVFYVPVLTAAP